MTKKMTAAEKALKAVLRAERPTATPAQKAKAHRIWASAYEHSNTVTKR